LAIAAASAAEGSSAAARGARQHDFWAVQQAPIREQPETSGVWADAVKEAETVTRTRRKENFFMGNVS
jgi:hypothetical protein